MHNKIIKKNNSIYKINKQIVLKKKVKKVHKP